MGPPRRLPVFERLAAWRSWRLHLLLLRAVVREYPGLLMIAASSADSGSDVDAQAEEDRDDAAPPLPCVEYAVGAQSRVVRKRVLVCEESERKATAVADVKPGTRTAHEAQGVCSLMRDYGRVRLWRRHRDGDRRLLHGQLVSALVHG